MTRARDLADSADKDIVGTLTLDGLDVAGNVSVDGGTIKLDGNYPVGTSNVALGDTALESAGATSKWNVAIGDQALQSLTTGFGNVSVGRNALESTTTAVANVAIGFQAGILNTTGSSNVAIGYESMEQNLTGDFNTAIGRGSLQNTTADNNTAVGYQALYDNVTGGQLVAVGGRALENNTGSNGTAVGYSSLFSNTSGANNSALGYNALFSNTTGSYNVGLGLEALHSSTTSNYNTAVGYRAGYSFNTSGSSANTFIGSSAGYSLTTGINSTFVGSGAGLNTTTGTSNIAVGLNPLYNNTTGSYNTSLGWQSLFSNTTANSNTAVGYKAGFSNTTSSDNTFVGVQAGHSRTGSGNTIVGQYAGRDGTTGVDNTFIGRNSGYTITTGSNNSILGLYNGNQGGLDIRTSSNNIVLSDGDGNPRQVINSAGRAAINTVTADAYSFLAVNGGVSTGVIHGITTSGTDTDGQHMVIRGGASTGTGAAGDVRIFPSTSQSSTSGSSITGYSYGVTKGMYLTYNQTNWGAHPSLFQLGLHIGSDPTQANRQGLGSTYNVISVESPASFELSGGNNAAGGKQANLMFYGSSSANPYAELYAYSAVGYTTGGIRIDSYDTGTAYEVARFWRDNIMFNGLVRPLTDNTNDIGSGSYRWDDIYATNGTIQTSDRNEKQDIEALSDAEQRVAVACKGLLRKFRWIDAVAEKGDDARIHFGIIAQDLQDAFAAEGLDAGRYAMFISRTWWETQTEVPAVEAVAEVLDEDGNVVTEAVEAKEAYTRTDTYETLEEAPEGATERTRLGVRYPELLAFIIASI